MALEKYKIYYTYEDVTIVPNVTSKIEHRKECVPFDENGMLPLFTAPMNTVVDCDNFEKFTNEMIYAILPRTEPIELRIDFSLKGRWAAYSLSEFEKVFCNEKQKLDESNGIKALIDIANGHMLKLFKVVEKAKNIYGDNIVLMGGNIANPHTYEAYAKAGIDYVRVGIGGGNGCLSSSNLGIHMPMASLIDEVNKVKNRLEENYSKLPKIIADGGIRNYRDIIKALALGADYVMIGSVFAKMLESAAPKTSDVEGVDKFLAKDFCSSVANVPNMRRDEEGIWHGEVEGKDFKVGRIKATFYGMASREGQIALNGAKTKTSEGILKHLDVEYTMHGWALNFADYLRSAMSYTDAKTLDQFRKDSTVIINSQNAVSAVNK